jgi:hypothetical protein
VTGPWADGPAPAVSVRRGAGEGGSDRVTLTWPDNAIRNTWLQVLVKATANTGLAGGTPLYFGHLAGETGDGAPVAGATVGVMDLVRTRGGISSSAVPITNRFDHNRDRRVDVLDAAVTRANQHATLPWMENPFRSTDPATTVPPTPTRLTPARSTGLLSVETPLV